MLHLNRVRDGLGSDSSSSRRVVLRRRARLLSALVLRGRVPLRILLLVYQYEAGSLGNGSCDANQSYLAFRFVRSPQ